MNQKIRQLQIENKLHARTLTDSFIWKAVFKMKKHVSFMENRKM
jgi:hypothetical protein